MLQDFRLAIRRVVRSPLFSVSVVVILAAGVGAGAAMWSVFYSLAIRPLNLPHPENLVAVSSADARGFSRITPLPALERLRKASLSAEGWCGYNSTIDATEWTGRVLESYGELLSGDCSAVIGLRPAIGRWFTEEEAPQVGPGSPVIVITDRYWKRMFDGSPDVLGASVRIQKVTVTVIGVMPESYRGFSQDLSVDFILPFNVHRASSGGLMYIGRLRPEASLGQLQSEVRTIWTPLLEAVLAPGPTKTQSLAELSGKAESIPGGFSVLRRLYAEPVRRLAILASALLLLVTVNVGGLMVSRVAGRMQEIKAMRALGANTLQTVRPLAMEAALFAVSGSALGIPVAYAASAAFATLLPMGNMPWTLVTTPDAKLFGWIVAVAVVLSAAISALPIWLALRHSQLRTNRTVAESGGRLTKAMLISQVAVTVVLVFACGLIVRSFNGLLAVDRGFRNDHLLSIRLAANPGGYNDLDPRAYYHALVQKLAAVPGVQSVGLARYFGTINSTMAEQPIGIAEVPDNATAGAMDFVSPGFFATIGAPLISGRDVEWTDLPSTPRVALVSESLARALAPDGNVVGRIIRYGPTAAYSRLQIVGVVGNISMGNLRNTTARMIYISSVQVGETAFATAHIRTVGPPLQLASVATEAVIGLGREHPLGVYQDVLFANSIVAERMGAVVSGIGSVLALIVSCVGLFALLSHSVQRRTREIGIRVAVGATPAALSRMVIGESMVLVVSGLALGIPGAIAAASLLRSLLYGVTTTDTVTLAVSVLLLLGTALIASAHPTIRAVKVDPSTALRAE